MATTTESRPATKLRAGIAKTAAERDACYRLRYQLHVEELGRKMAAGDKETQRLTDSIDDTATTLFVANGDDVVATVRVVAGTDAIPDAYVPSYDIASTFKHIPRRELAFVSFMASAPEWRKSEALGMLLGTMYRHVRAQGSWLLFSTAAPQLVSTAESLGFRRFKPNFSDPEFGLRIPVALVADDLPYLERLKSPFARIAAEFKNDPSHATWFTQTFSAYAQPSSTRHMDPEALQYIGTRLFADDHLLFRGLSQSEVDKVLSAATILRARAGETIVRTGDPGGEMYTLLSGAAEVRGHSKGGANTVLQTLGRGHVFGEMALLNPRPRSADVVAISDVELLMISREFTERLVTDAPSTAARMLWNLAVLLSDRLNMTTTAYLAELRTEAH